MDKAFCQLSVVTRSSFVQYLRCSSPNNKATSKWHRFGVFQGFWLSGSSISSKKWLSQCRGTILWLWASVFGSCCHMSWDRVPKVVLYSLLWSKYGWRRLKQYWTTLSPKKTVVDNCALHKMLLVVFFHHRALLSLPQLSYSANTGCSRASFSCLVLGQHGVSRHGLY